MGRKGRWGRGRGSQSSDDAVWEMVGLRESFGSKSYVHKGETFETYRPAYRYGAEAEARYQGRKFAEVEADLRSGWEKALGEWRIVQIPAGPIGVVGYAAAVAGHASPVRSGTPVMIPW